MTSDDLVRRKLSDLVEQAFWSINEPFCKNLEDIGTLLHDHYFPDKNRKALVLWKNLDGRSIALPFEQGLKCPSFRVSTQRLTDTVREIKNKRELETKIQEMLDSSYRPEVVLFLDAVAGSGATALSVRDTVMDILGYQPTFYFYCVFGSEGVEDNIRGSIQHFKVLRDDYDLDTRFHPPRLKWFIMSDLGDRYPDRNEGGTLLETPLDERIWIGSRLEAFLGGIEETRSKVNLHEENLIYNTGDLAIIGGALYAAERGSRQWGLGEWVPQDSILALVKVACIKEDKLKKYLESGEEIEFDDRGHLHHPLTLSKLYRFGGNPSNPADLGYGYFEHHSGPAWRLRNPMMAYFKMVMEDVLSQYEWFNAMDHACYYALTDLEELRVLF